jgi:hypothetical protein
VAQGHSVSGTVLFSLANKSQKQISWKQWRKAIASNSSAQAVNARLILS